MHWYTQEIKKQRPSPGEPARKKSKIELAVGKGMATVFWGSQDVVYIHRIEGEGQNAHRALLCRIIEPI